LVHISVKGPFKLGEYPSVMREKLVPKLIGVLTGEFRMYWKPDEGAAFSVS